MNQEIKKPFYLSNEALPTFCVERGEDLDAKIFIFGQILEALDACPSILELIEQYTCLGQTEHARKTLSGFIEMNKMYHLFASEQFEILKEEIRLETAKK